MGDRRPFSPQFKVERVLELLNGTHPATEVCRTHGITPSLPLARRKRLWWNRPRNCSSEKASGIRPKPGVIHEFELKQESIHSIKN